MCTEFGADSSSRFPFRVWTVDTHTDTHIQSHVTEANDYPILHLGYPRINNDANCNNKSVSVQLTTLWFKESTKHLQSSGK